MNAVLVDTGFLVALFRRDDRLRGTARDYLEAHNHPLVTVAPVIVETCLFLDARGKVELLTWAERGGIDVVDIAPGAYPVISAIILKYADREIDFADAALVWHANDTRMRAVLTVDAKDFTAFRLQGGTRFDVIPWC